MNIFNIEPDELYYSMNNFKNIGLGFQTYENPEYSGKTVTLNGKDLIHFANCSYLGLEKNPIIIESAIQAIKQYGTQNSMSRAFISSPQYLEIEALFREIFHGYPILYPTTTLGHCSTLPLLAKDKDAIILDAYVHASVRMASQICKANGTFVIISKHNDMDHVRYLVKRLKKDGYRNIWYCADGIYSMQGDVCDVKGLQQLLDEEENVYAYVDDAHGIGCIGEKGSGYVIGNFGLHKKMIVAGSLSKTLALSGGFLIIPDKELADYLKLTGHTLIFAAPLPPVILGALIASFKLFAAGKMAKLQEELIELIVYFRTNCQNLSIPLATNVVSPIQLITIGNEEKILNVQKKLFDKGFYASVAAYPAVSKGNEGIRISITTHITKKDIDRLLESLVEILKTEKMKTPIAEEF